MFGVLVLGILLAWSLLMGYFLLHLSDHSMESGCPLMVGQGACMDGQTPLTVVQKHMNFIRQLTQATLQSSILALVLFAVLLLRFFRPQLVPLILRQRLRPLVPVDDTPREQRKRHWLALHEQRDPYRF